MIEPAALLGSVESIALAPVPDGVRGDALAVLGRKLSGAERAVEEGRYDEAVSILGELRLVPGHHPALALRGLLAESWRGCTARSSMRRSSS